MDKKDLKKSYLYKGVTAFLVVAASILFYFLILRIGSVNKFLGKLFGVLQPLIFGLVIAYLVNPIIRFSNKLLVPFLSKRMKDKKSAEKICDVLSVTISLLLFCVIIGGLVWLVVPQLIDTVSGLVTVLPGQIDNIAEKAEKMLKRNEKLQSIFVTFLDYEKNWLETDLATYVNKAAASLASGVWSAVNFVKNFGIGLVFAIYILLSRRKFMNQSKKLCYAVLKEKTVDALFLWVKKTHTVFSGFISGKLIDSLIIGVFCFIGVSLMRTPYPVLLAVVIGATNVIPVFGPWIGGIPMTLLVMLTEPVKGLYFGIFVILLQTLDGNILGPKILGDKIGIDTFWVVFAIIFGGGLFGVAGMLIGVPAFAVVYCIVVTFINYLLGKKNKSTYSGDYYNSNGDIKEEGETDA